MASTEQDLVEEALQEFQLRLHFELPQTRHRHFTEFFDDDDEAHMEEVTRQETAEVTNKFIDNITALRISPGRMGDLVSGLCLKIQALIDDCIAKNRENKTKSESFLMKRIESVCDDFKSSIETKLVLDPEMDMKALEKLVEREKCQGLGYFDYWKHGNVNFYLKERKKLKGKLNQLKKEMIDKHRRARRPTPENPNPNRVEEEMNETASVSVAPASELNEAVSIKVEVEEGLSDIDSDCGSDSTMMIPAPAPQVESQKKRRECGTNAGQFQVQEELENNKQPQSKLAIKNEGQSNSMGIRIRRHGNGPEGETIAGSSGSPSKRPRLSETPPPSRTGITESESEDPLIFQHSSNQISLGTGFRQLKDGVNVDKNASVASDINDAVKMKVEVLSDIDSDSDSAMGAIPGPQIQSQIEGGTNAGRPQEHLDKRTQPDLDLTTKNEAQLNSDPNGIKPKRHGLEGEPIAIASSSGSASKRPSKSKLIDIPPPGSSTAFSSAPTESKDPLIFRLADNCIYVAIRVDFDKFRHLEDQCIYPAVAVDENGHLVVGVGALECPEYFMLEDCLEGSASDRKKLSFTIGKERTTQEVHLEFLLGLLLKTSKDSAESHLKKSFRTAIITVPMWFCSSQRLQVKDAAYVAGFNMAHLINQETIAVIPFPSKAKDDILVLAENFGIVSGVLYQNRKMVRDEHRRSKRNDSAESKWDKLHSMSSALKLNQCSGRKIMVYATESRQWGLIFQDFAKRSGFQCRFSGHSGESKLFGASIFCEKTVEEVHATVSQYFPCKLDPYGVNEPTTKWLTEPLKCQVPLEDFLKPCSPTVVQKSVRNGEMVPLGEVQFKGSEKYSEEYCKKAFMSSMLVLKFKTDYEGIVTLERMEVEELEGEMRGSEILLAEDFVWNTPALKEADRGNVRRLVDLIRL